MGLRDPVAYARSQLVNSEVSHCPILETRLYMLAHLGSQEDTLAGRVKETSGKAGPDLMPVDLMPVCPSPP